MHAVRQKHFSNKQKWAAIELWWAKIPLKNIRKLLQMSESTLRIIVAFTKAIKSHPIRTEKQYWEKVQGHSVNGDQD